MFQAFLENPAVICQDLQTMRPSSDSQSVRPSVGFLDDRVKEIGQRPSSGDALGKPSVDNRLIARAVEMVSELQIE